MSRLACEFSPEQRQQIATWAAAGVKQTEIARALHIHRNTLAKYFRPELAAAAARARMEICVALYKRAIKGHVGAARLYLSGALGRHRG